MRFLALCLCFAAYVSLSLASSIPGLPTCAGGCVPADLGGCNTVDVACICGNTALIANLTCCVSTACDAADQETTIEFADALCSGAGVTNLPTAATCASSAAAAASSTTATGSVTSATGSAASSASSLVSSASSVASSDSSVAATATSASKASSATSAAASSTGAASRVELGMGMGAILAGALAVL